ncbi:MAG: folate family ECF transporter S component, partial [Halanaerobiales bacterium]|nr:folate family ECF transporter S component [Halanaerobiales bacterium]
LRFAIGGVEGIRIGFASLPIIIGGIFFGPVIGGLIGGIADILGYFINPLGAYMPHFTLTSFLTGFIPGLVIYYGFNHKINTYSLVISIMTGQVISSVILVPVFLQMLFSIPIKVTIVPKIVGEGINIFLYTYIIKVLVKRELLKLESLNSYSKQ